LRQRSLAASGLEVRRPPALVLRTTDALEFDLIAMTFISIRPFAALPPLRSEPPWRRRVPPPWASRTPPPGAWPNWI